MLSQHVEVVSGRTRSYCNGALNQLQCSRSRTTRRLFLILQTSRLYRTLISALTYTGPNAADTSGYSSHTSLLSALGLYLLSTFLFSAVFAPHFSPVTPKRETDRPDPSDRSDPSQIYGLVSPLRAWRAGGAWRPWPEWNRPGGVPYPRPDWCATRTRSA